MKRLSDSRHRSGGTHLPRNALLVTGLLAVLAVPVMQAMSGPAAGAQAAAPVPITTCNEATLQQDASVGGSYQMECSGDIAFHAPIKIGKGQQFTLSGEGESVQLDGQHISQLFIVSGGSLTLSDLYLINGSESAPFGAPGMQGKDGKPTPGPTGTLAEVGTAPVGDHRRRRESRATRWVRSGCTGGRPRNRRWRRRIEWRHRAGQRRARRCGRRRRSRRKRVSGSERRTRCECFGPALLHRPPRWSDLHAIQRSRRRRGWWWCRRLGCCGRNGGQAKGGAIYNAGDLSIFNSSFVGNSALGGEAGTGGQGGAGGAGGSGGEGAANAGPICNGTPCGPGGNGTAAQAGANAGSGGQGGDGLGGAIYNAFSGEMTVQQTTFSENSALGGQAGSGLTGGPGGDGGSGGQSVGGSKRGERG